MKTQNYSLNEIFEKKLLFLLPFYIFTHEKNFEKYNMDASSLLCLMQEFADMREQLESLTEAGSIDVFTKCTIIDMTGKVVENLARKYGKVREGVKSVMGGKILDYEAKRIRNAGFCEGEARGIIETGFDFGLSESDILNRLQQKMNISLQTAQEYFNMFTARST